MIKFDIWIYNVEGFFELANKVEFDTRISVHPFSNNQLINTISYKELGVHSDTLLDSEGLLKIIIPVTQFPRDVVVKYDVQLGLITILMCGRRFKVKLFLMKKNSKIGFDSRFD